MLVYFPIKVLSDWLLKRNVSMMNPRSEECVGASTWL